MHIFVTSDQGPDLCLASLARAAFNAYGRLPDVGEHKFELVIVPMIEINVMGELEDRIEKKVRAYPLETLTLFGDYWGDDDLELYRERYSTKPNIWQYAFDGTATMKLAPNVTSVESMSATTFLFRRVETIMQQYIPRPITSVGSLKRTACSRFFDLLDDRCRGMNPEDTQALITGCMNYPLFDGSLMERFDCFFEMVTTDPSLETKVLLVGTSMIGPQRLLVQERVKENSSRRVLNCGVLCAVSSASEHINLTHEELNKIYPEAVITCVLKLWINIKDFQMAYSLRSWNESFDVSTLVRPHGGGGTKSAAGVRLPLNFEFPF
jgi:hypothetical protein